MEISNKTKEELNKALKDMLILGECYCKVDSNGLERLDPLTEEQIINLKTQQMRENKYYTPTIEEFHIGFEFEKHDERTASYRSDGYIPTNYHKFKYDLKSIRLSQLGTHLFEKTIRVKYLDKEDIESLGWKYAQYLDRTTICLNFERSNNWYLNYWFGEIPYVEICRDGYDTGCALNIKNKSQLKFIMKCLGILE